MSIHGIVLQNWHSMVEVMFGFTAMKRGRVLLKFIVLGVHSKYIIVSSTDSRESFDCFVELGFTFRVVKTLACNTLRRRNSPSVNLAV